MPSSDYDSMGRASPPPTAANIASAYPPNTSPSSSLTRLLALVTFLALLCVLVLHYIDHPRTRSIKNVTDNIVSYATGGKGKIIRSTQVDNVGKIAACFSGNVGTLSKVAKQNIDEIRTLDPQANFFYHLDLQDDYYHDRSGQYYNTKHEIGEFQSIFDMAKAVAVKTYSAQAVTIPVSESCETKQQFKQAFLQFYAAAGCYQLIKQAEDKAGRDFKWIIQAQPNMHIKVKMPPDNAYPRVHMSGSAMAFMPRKLADDYYSILNAFYASDCNVLEDVSSQACRNYSYDAVSTACWVIKWLGKADIIPSNGVYLNRRIVYPGDMR